jgi:hypothetical protein
VGLPRFDVYVCIYMYIYVYVNIAAHIPIYIYAHDRDSYFDYRYFLAGKVPAILLRHTNSYTSLEYVWTKPWMSVQGKSHRVLNWTPSYIKFTPFKLKRLLSYVSLHFPGFCDMKYALELFGPEANTSQSCIVGIAQPNTHAQLGPWVHEGKATCSAPPSQSDPMFHNPNWITQNLVVVIILTLPERLRKRFRFHH